MTSEQNDRAIEMLIKHFAGSKEQRPETEIWLLNGENKLLFGMNGDQPFVQKPFHFITLDGKTKKVPCEGDGCYECAKKHRISLLSEYRVARGKLSGVMFADWKLQKALSEKFTELLNAKFNIFKGEIEVLITKSGKGRETQYLITVDVPTSQAQQNPLIKELGLDLDNVDDLWK